MKYAEHTLPFPRGEEYNVGFEVNKTHSKYIRSLQPGDKVVIVPLEYLKCHDNVNVTMRDFCDREVTIKKIRRDRGYNGENSEAIFYIQEDQGQWSWASNLIRKDPNLL